MASVDQIVSIYRDLADWHDRQGQAQLRDRFLVLAAQAALSGRRNEEAERLRHVLLQLNPHHLLKPFTSFAEAMKSPDVQSYITDLQQSYPPEAAERLLQSVESQGGGGEEDFGDQLAATMPVMEPVAPLPSPPASTTEPLKVYRVQMEPEQPTERVPVRPPPPQRPVPPKSKSKVLAEKKPSPPPAPIPVAPPVPPPPPAAPIPPARPVRPLQTYPVRHEPPGRPPIREKVREPIEPEGRPGSWFPAALFAVLLGAGLALAVYTFVRPFWPMH